jgi:uncharacterized membrane protein YadS
MFIISFVFVIATNVFQLVDDKLNAERTKFISELATFLVSLSLVLYAMKTCMKMSRE